MFEIENALYKINDIEECADLAFQIKFFGGKYLCFCKIKTTFKI